MEKKVDVCCHCGKKVGGYYTSPRGYYYITSSLIGAGSILHHVKDEHAYRLCLDCFEKLKDIAKDFFTCEVEDG